MQYDNYIVLALFFVNSSFTVTPFDFTVTLLKLTVTPLGFTVTLEVLL